MKYRKLKKNVYIFLSLVYNLIVLMFIRTPRLSAFKDQDCELESFQISRDFLWKRLQRYPAHKDEPVKSRESMEEK